jgi:hypothetical protein
VARSLAAGNEVFYWLDIDATPNTYAGNLLLCDVEFQYA